MEHAPLEAVYIFIDTATYDEIERDEKVTTSTVTESVIGDMFELHCTTGLSMTTV